MNNKKSIRDILLSKIKEGQVVMRPKWHFVLKAVLGLLGIVILAFATLYLISFIFFTLRATGVLFAPGFGFRGIGPFLFSLPWLLILASLVFIVFLETLVKRYSFAYRKPLLYSVFAIICFVAIGSLVMSQVGFHDRISRFAEKRRTPFVNPFYHDYAMPHSRDVHPGVISELTEKGLTLTTRRQETIQVIVTPETSFPYGLDLQVGDEIVVLGKRTDNTIQAAGIRRIDERKRLPSRGPGWHGPVIAPQSVR